MKNIVYPGHFVILKFSRLCHKPQVTNGLNSQNSLHKYAHNAKIIFNYKIKFNIHLATLEGGMGLL